MFEPADLGGAILTLFIADNDLGYFQVQFGCSEKEVEIPERIKIAKVPAVPLNGLIIPFEQHLCSTQGIFQSLPEEVAEKPSEKLVRQEIE